MQNYEKVAQSEQAQKLIGAVDVYSKKVGGLWKLLFFTCACCVTASGVLSIVVGILSFAAPFDFINYVYLTFFGLLMLVIDFPIDTPVIRNFKFSIYHYALFMTRFLGRGFWFLFLGCMCVGALWDNSVCPFLGFILGGYLGAVAICSIVKSIELSKRLEKMRQKVASMGPDQWGDIIPPNGLTKMGFRDLANELVGISFNDDEQNYIVNALSFEVRADDVISRDEFEDWVRGPGMTWL